MNIIKQYDILARFCTGLGTLANATAAVVNRQRPPDCQSAAPPRLAQRKTCLPSSKSFFSKKVPQSVKGVRIAALALVSTAMMTFAPGMASAQIVTTPPQLPMDITVFPERDFVSVAGFAPNADVVIQVRRSGLVGEAFGRTNALGAIEVNHPGGVCWKNVTPDIVPADIIRVTYRDTNNNRALKPIPVKDSGAALNTQNVKATQAFDNNDGTVVVKGSAVLPGGGRVPLNRLEVRIVNPELIDPGKSAITKRDIRADSLGGRIDGIPGATGTLAYDATTGTEFTAVFRGLNDYERLLAVQGQTRVMGWQQTTPAGDRLGMTIYEVGEIGGPGMGGCPPGANPAATPPAPTAPKPPVAGYNLNGLLDAGVQSNQHALKDVTVFPERDFVSIAGFIEGTELQVVVRRGTGDKPVIGTARGFVGRSGVFEVNHPGGVCWSGQTPDIRPGDMVDVVVVYQTQFSSGQTQQVIDARVDKPAAFINANGDIRVNGTAFKDGLPLPLQFMEQRIINPDFAKTRIGRRDIRADTSGGRIDNVPGGGGNLLRTGDDTSIEWRAIYKGLNEEEKQIAIAGQSRAMAWLSTNGNGDRFGLTISEFGELGGPGMGGCPSTGSESIAIP